MNFTPTLRKIFIGLVAVALTYAAVIVWGLLMLSRSNSYAMAQREVGRRLQIPDQIVTDSVRIRWWKSWTYRESGANGLAQFTLCGKTPGRAEICFNFIMTKTEGVWNIDSIKKS